jgi:hypothetical protein
MRKFCLLVLALGIVALSAGTSQATVHAKSTNGSEITWSTGYPKATTQVGFIQPVVYTRFAVSAAAGWSPSDVSYQIRCYADNGGYNGYQAASFYSAFSEEHGHYIYTAGTTATVNNIYLSVSNDTTFFRETATEADSGSLTIR